ncbi:MAG: hypothetical protein ACWGO1_00590, partial [Anaerolineales bacterium]
TFGRDLDDYDDTTRINRINISKNWAHYNLNAELRWYDNIIARYPFVGLRLRSLLQGLEKSPLRILGLSHFWVVERARA